MVVLQPYTTTSTIIMLGIAGIIFLCLYFLPSIIRRKKRRALAIFQMRRIWRMRRIWPVVTIAGTLWILLLYAAWIGWQKGWASRAERNQSPPDTVLKSFGAASSEVPTSQSSSLSSPPATTEPTDEDPVDDRSEFLSVQQVLKAFQEARLPIARSVIYTEETDPNNLLGRPNQYIGKASWHDERDGFGNPKGLNYTVEVFGSLSDLVRRHRYLDTLSKPAPFLAEYEYAHKNALLRLNRRLTPQQARQYEAIFRTVTVKSPAAAPTAEAEASPIP